MHKRGRPGAPPVQARGAARFSMARTCALAHAGHFHWLSFLAFAASGFFEGIRVVMTEKLLGQVGTPPQHPCLPCPIAESPGLAAACGLMGRPRWLPLASMPPCAQPRELWSVGAHGTPLRAHLPAAACSSAGQVQRHGGPGVPGALHFRGPGSGRLRL